jgi:hypothetical protein
MDDSEKLLLQAINLAIQNPSVIAQIDAIADRVERNFTSSREPLAWESVPLALYGDSLPSEIRSSWVFLLREGSASGAERHPNSHQRVRSWRRSGDFQVRIGDRWESHFLENNFDVPLERQWASIPVNVWHQAVVGPVGHWIVLSFHTAAAEDLIEERPDALESGRMNQRLYTAIHEA